MALDPDADSFNEPGNDDTTSAPSFPQLPNRGNRPMAGESSPILSRLKQMASLKQKPPRSPKALASAINRSRRARQSSYRYGQ